MGKPMDARDRYKSEIPVKRGELPRIRADDWRRKEVIMHKKRGLYKMTIQHVEK